MSEIEKMYENAGINPTHYDACKIADAYWLNEELANEYGTFDNYMKLNCIYHYQECTDECRHSYDRDTYPPFTPAKQLELIKFLMKQEDFSWTIAQQDKDTKYAFYVGYEYGSGDFKEFTEALAGIINDLWSMRSLTEEEKKQIREILK